MWEYLFREERERSAKARKDVPLWFRGAAESNFLGAGKYPGQGMKTSKKSGKFGIVGVMIRSWRYSLAVLLFFFCAAPRGAAGGFGENAIWVAHHWARSESTPEKLNALLDAAASANTCDLYLNLGVLEGDGDLRIAGQAARFVSEVGAYNRRKGTGLIVLAWINADSREVDLSKARVRKRIVGLAVRLMGLGYGGLVYDIEPNPKEPNDLLALLEESRKAIGWSRALVVYSSPWGEEYDSWHWDSDFYLVASKPATYLELGLYNSRQEDIGDYHEWIRDNLVNVTQSVAEEKRGVIRLALPAHDAAGDQTVSHHVKTEGLSTALSGVKRAWQDVRIRHEAIGGVSAYGEWCMDSREWELLRGLDVGGKR